MFGKIKIPLEALRPSRCCYVDAYVNNRDRLDSNQGTLVWLGQGVMDADGSAVLTGPCEFISNTLAVGEELKTELWKERDPEQ